MCPKNDDKKSFQSCYQKMGTKDINIWIVLYKNIGERRVYEVVDLCIKENNEKLCDVLLSCLSSESMWKKLKCIIITTIQKVSTSLSDPLPPLVLLTRTDTRIIMNIRNVGRRIGVRVFNR